MLLNRGQGLSTFILIKIAQKEGARRAPTPPNKLLKRNEITQTIAAARFPPSRASPPHEALWSAHWQRPPLPAADHSLHLYLLGSVPFSSHWPPRTNARLSRGEEGGGARLPLQQKGVRPWGPVRRAPRFVVRPAPPSFVRKAIFSTWPAGVGAFSRRHGGATARRSLRGLQGRLPAPCTHSFSSIPRPRAAALAAPQPRHPTPHARAGAAARFFDNGSGSSLPFHAPTPRQPLLSRTPPPSQA